MDFQQLLERAKIAAELANTAREAVAELGENIAAARAALTANQAEQLFEMLKSARAETGVLGARLDQALAKAATPR